MYVGVNGTAGALNVSGYGATVKSITIGSLGTVDISVAHPLNSLGAATFASGSTIVLSGFSLPGDTLPEPVMYFSGTPTGTFTSTNLPAGYTLAYNSGVLDIVTTGPSTWTLAQDGNWSDGSKWTGPVPNATAAGAIITQSDAVSGHTVTLDVPVTLGTLELGNSGNTSLGYTLTGSSGNTLTLNNSGSGATIAVDSGTHVVNAPVILADNLTVSGSGLLTFSPTSTVTDGGSHKLTVAGPGTVVIAGSGAIGSSTNVPAGTLEVDGAWTTSVLNVTASGGTQGTGLLAGSGTITVTGDNLYYNSSGTSTFAGTLASASPGLEVDGGMLILTGNNSYQGGTDVEPGGVLIAAVPGSLPDNGSLTVNGTLLFGGVPYNNGSPMPYSAGGSPTPLSEPAAVPEPGTLVLLAAGLAMALAVWRRKISDRKFEI